MGRLWLCEWKRRIHEIVEYIETIYYIMILAKKQRAADWTIFTVGRSDVTINNPTRIVFLHNEGSLAVC